MLLSIGILTLTNPDKSSPKSRRKLGDILGFRQPPKLLPPSILDTYKVFEHIDILSKGIQLQPYTYTVILTLLDSDFGVLGHMSNRNDAIRNG
jgi:hypothetical protein